MLLRGALAESVLAVTRLFTLDFGVDAVAAVEVGAVAGAVADEVVVVTAGVDISSVSVILDSSLFTLALLDGASDSLAVLVFVVLATDSTFGVAFAGALLTAGAV